MADAANFNVKALVGRIQSYLEQLRSRLTSQDSAVAAAGEPPTPKNVKQRWLIVGGVLAVGVAVVAGMSSDGPRQKSTVAAEKKAQAERARMVDVTPKDLDRKSWQAQSMVEMERLRRDLDKLSVENAAISKQLQQVQKTAEESAKAAAAAAIAGARPEAGGVVAPPVPRSKAVPGAQQPGGVRGGVAGTGPSGAVTRAPTVPGLPPAPPVPSDSAHGTASPAIFPDEPLEPPAAPLISRPPAAPAKAVSAEAATKDAEVKSRLQVKESPYAGQLPPGSFAEVALLHGLDAATGSTAQANPQPILLNVQNHAILPGSAKYQLKSCFFLGSGYGDLSSERVYVQLAKLSCVDKKNKMMLSADVQGYVVDSDGRLGLRGIVIDRQGAKLAKSMLAGFAEGLAGALKMSQGSVATSPLGSVTSMAGDQAVRAAGLQGAASGASQLSQFYLKEASSMFPVLSIDSARLASVVIQSGANLKWAPQDTVYEQTVVPTEARR